MTSRTLITQVIPWIVCCSRTSRGWRATENKCHKHTHTHRFRHTNRDSDTDTSVDTHTYTQTHTNIHTHTLTVHAHSQTLTFALPTCGTEKMGCVHRTERLRARLHLCRSTLVLQQLQQVVTPLTTGSYTRLLHHRVHVLPALPVAHLLRHSAPCSAAARHS